jgi:hypothetical protein
MAGRPMNKLHQDDVRKKIQASQLINVLQDHAFGHTEELSVTRMKAIEILLKKSLPDLSSITLENGTDEDGNKVGFQVIQRTIVEPNKP